jgi:hypothetical protein
MELLPVAFIGWFFTIASIAALVVGAMLIMAMHRAGELERRFLARGAWNDMALFAIWILGLAGGVGVIQLRPWGRDIMEFFCWTLIALIGLSAFTRVLAIKRDSAHQPVNWVAAIAGVLVVLIPVVAICGATIATLRSASVRQLFAG